MMKFTGIPNFAPELFRRIRLKDPLKQKQLLKGLVQLSEEGAVQVFRPIANNDLIVGAVGVLQFDVVVARLKSEYNVEAIYESVNVATARWVESTDVKKFEEFKRKNEVQLALDGGDNLTYIAPTMVNLNLTQERYPDVVFRKRASTNLDEARRRPRFFLITPPFPSFWKVLKTPLIRLFFIHILRNPFVCLLYLIRVFKNAGVIHCDKTPALVKNEDITMTRLKNANMLLALFLGLAALNASAETEKTTVDSAKSAASNAGEAVDNSINKVGDFMDDSTITARVKAALIDHKDINSGDISVKTENKVVTLSGDVTSAEQKSQALSVAKEVKGVSHVNDKLTVHHKSSSETATLKGYAGDTAITSEVKAKLLADDIVPSRNVKVETNAGAVHLTGTVASAAQAERAAEIAKAVSGVKSVRNDLSVK